MYIGEFSLNGNLHSAGTYQLNISGTPHTSHYVNARAALLAKKHVLLEKPATCNAAELQDLIDTAKEQKVFFMEAMWTRFLPISKEFKKIVEEGQLGEPVMMWADLSGDFNIYSECVFLML